MNETKKADFQETANAKILNEKSWKLKLKFSFLLHLYGFRKSTNKYFKS